ncbi:unnamed protein product (mitochondrion) [Sympodiomycopsis kandeliae]
MLCIGLISILFSVPLFSHRITPTLFNRITCLILIYCAILSRNVLYIKSLKSGIGIYNGLFHVTTLSITFEAFIFVCAAIILIAFPKNKEIRSIEISEYPLIVLFAVVGQCLLISRRDLVSMYLSLELQSFAVYVIATLYRKRERATIAGLKYFLLGGLSSALILLGTALIYSYTGLRQFEDIYTLFQTLGQNDYLEPVILGFCLIQIGFLFKIASAPLHNWAPDVYDGVPTAVTIFLQTIPKISIFLFIVEIQTGLLGSFDSLSLIQDNTRLCLWKNLVLYASLSSLCLGTVVGLSQYRIKRLLAYSTISHVGFILLCLQVNSQESISSFLFYIIQYSLTNICAFLCLLAFSYVSIFPRKRSKNIRTKKIIDIEVIRQLANQFKNQPLLAFSLSICLFSIAGIPPLIGFFAKQIVLSRSIAKGYYFICIVCLVVSVIRAVYYLKIIKVLYFEPSNVSSFFPEKGNAKNKNTDKEKSIIIRNKNTNRVIIISNTTIISNVHRFFIAILTVIITLFIFIPEILLNTCNLLALTLFYY